MESFVYVYVNVYESRLPWAVIVERWGVRQNSGLCINLSSLY